MKNSLFKLLGVYKLSFLLIAMLFSTAAFAQQEFKLTGVLIEEGTKIRIALADVTNIRNRYSVGSNDMGLFEIKAAIGDTVLISKRGFTDLRIVVGGTQALMLKLNRGMVLDEVLIKGKTKQQSLADIDRDFRAKGSFYAGKPPLALLSPFGGSPLTFFYELFGKTPRDARRFRKYWKTENEQSQIDRFFNPTLVNKYTGLENKELNSFMIRFRPDYAQTKNWGEYDGIKWIVDSYQKYKDNPKSTF